MLPKISVITPSYNQGIYLEETIRSVFGQEYPNLEYIIIDGGSTDDSVSIIKKYAGRLSYWESARDRGFGHAINKGFARATGDILCWVNSDDILLPGALQTVGQYFAAYPAVGLVFGDRHVLDQHGTLKRKRPYYFYLGNQLRYAKTLPQEATFWRRSAFEAAGSHLDEALKFTIDLDLWCRISKVAKIRHIPFYLGAFRDQPLSKSSTISALGLVEREATIRKYFDRYPSGRELKIYQFWLGMLRRVYRLAGVSAWKRWKVQRALKFNV